MKEKKDCWRCERIGGTWCELHGSGASEDDVPNPKGSFGAELGNEKNYEGKQGLLVERTDWRNGV